MSGDRTPQARAEQLADVALAVYETGGRGVHVPLDKADPLIVVLRLALSQGHRCDAERRAAAGAEVAAALLEGVLRSHDMPSVPGTENQCFKYLIVRSWSILVLDLDNLEGL